MELLNSKETARFLGISMSTLYRMTCKGEIPHIKRRGVGLRFDRKKLERWLEQAERGLQGRGR